MMTHQQLMYAGCTIEYGFKRIGGKYKGRIIWLIHEQGVLRYGELKKLIAGITTKMLTQTLRELEADELINRKAYEQRSPRVEYTLTENGRELVPLIGQVQTWAEERAAKDPAMQQWKRVDS